MNKEYDFSGWAARNDILCSDGTTIKKDAFKHNDGMRVPLVWNHCHNEPFNILGFADLENREEGVYSYCSFNDTDAGRDAKDLVIHGDIDSLSIYANKIKYGGQSGKDVIHGFIREVSLVLAGADPTAKIEAVLEHDEESGEGGIMDTGFSIDEYGNYCPIGLSINHSDTEEPEKPEEKSEEKQVAEEKKEKTVQDVFDTLNEEQKKVVYALIGAAVEDAKKEKPEEKEEKEEKEEPEGGKTNMKHNVFEGEDTNNGAVLSHSDIENIFKGAKRLGSLKDAVLEFAENNETIAHAVTDRNGKEVTYGIADIDYLFPDARAINNTPDFIKREDGWVKKVMNGTHHTPFSRIKSVHANITMDEARARGYIKGKAKVEEVFSLLKRATDPQTIYKKQKLDRDDIIDITDFDVVAWIKMEMRMMLEEEIARAILVGDGRPSSSDDKISEDHIKPVWKDADLYTIKKMVTFKENATGADKAKAVIDAAVRSRKDYKGSGSPTLFTTEDWLTEMLLIEDGIGHKLYKSEAELATAMRVKEIVTVPVMEGLTRINGGETVDLVGLIVNLNDYNIGADKGGQTAMFDDFDIDYNQYKYLIETRCSGALIKPYCAIALECEHEEEPASL